MGMKTANLLERQAPVSQCVSDIFATFSRHFRDFIILHSRGQFEGRDGPSVPEWPTPLRLLHRIDAGWKLADRSVRCTSLKRHPAVHV